MSADNFNDVSQYFSFASAEPVSGQILFSSNDKSKKQIEKKDFGELKIGKERCSGLFIPSKVIALNHYWTK